MSLLILIYTVCKNFIFFSMLAQHMQTSDYAKHKAILTCEHLVLCCMKDNTSFHLEHLSNLASDVCHARHGSDMLSERHQELMYYNVVKPVHSDLSSIEYVWNRHLVKPVLRGHPSLLKTGDPSIQVIYRAD